MSDREQINKQKREYYRNNKEQCLGSSRKWKTKNKERVKEYRKKYRLEHKGEKREANRRWRKENPEKYLASAKSSTQKYKAKYPERVLATNKVNNAVRDGRALKEPCIMCGITKDIHGHHKDYSKKLDVVWMCRFHHDSFHRCMNSQGMDR